MPPPKVRRRLAVATLGTLCLVPLWARQNFTCASCHRAQAESQPRTSMAHAMELPASCAILRDHPRLTFHQDPYTWEIVTQNGHSTYTVTHGKKTMSVSIGWAVGLGRAGQTYVYERDGRFYESRVSYFDEVGGLDLTMGAARFPMRNLEEAAGGLLPAAEAAECFSCHASGAVNDGHVHTESLIPGLQCAHCHEHAQDHLAAMQDGAPGVIPPKLGGMSSDATSAFCGRCHRTWERVAAEGPTGVLNVRFQPYRLESSKCWSDNDARIRCTACHDPHQEVVRGASAYDTKCLACHAGGPADAQAHPAKACKVASAGCAECHMPKIDLPGAHAKFTDHQIRIVRKNEAYPD